MQQCIKISARLCSPSSRHRFFSTETQTQPSPSLSNYLRSLIKPFYLKCHPDVAPTESAKKINLEAIQNLNSYIDSLQTLALGQARKTLPSPDDVVVAIDFVMRVPDESTRKKRLNDEPSMSRRKVELLMPPPELWRSLSNPQTKNLSLLRQRLREHSAKELVKLLTMAGLDVPRDAQYEAFDWDRALNLFGEFEDGDDERSSSSAKTSSTEEGRGIFRTHYQRPRTRYEQNRDKFVSGIQWHKIPEIYEKAKRDLEADEMTEGMISKHRGRRRAMIGRILSRVRIEPNQDGQTISFVEQLITFRRLSLLLDQHFDELQMEQFGAMWESARLVLTHARSFNSSSSALHKRRNRQDAGNGYLFTLHPNNTVTMHIPADFRDEELIKQLDQNIWDFYNFIGDGTEGIFPETCI
jgi:hypothetical protein